MTTELLNYSQPAQNNRAAILQVLRRQFIAGGKVVEIGSGSGQHALHFAAHLPHLVWQPTDCGDYFEPLCRNLAVDAPANVLPPIFLDVAVSGAPSAGFSYAYSANVLHIMAEYLMPRFFEVMATALIPGGLACVYGPFRYNGKFTTESNQRFDQWLRARDPASGVRDIEIVTAIAGSCGLALVMDEAMPANNQMLVLLKETAAE